MLRNHGGSGRSDSTVDGKTVSRGSFGSIFHVGEVSMPPRGGCQLGSGRYGSSATFRTAGLLGNTPRARALECEGRRLGLSAPASVSRDSFSLFAAGGKGRYDRNLATGAFARRELDERHGPGRKAAGAGRSSADCGRPAR